MAPACAAPAYVASAPAPKCRGFRATIVGGDPRTDKTRPETRDVISYAHAPRGVAMNLKRGIARGQGKDRITNKRGLAVLDSRKDDTIKAGGPSLVAVTGSGDDTIRGSNRSDYVFPDQNSTRVTSVRPDPFIGGAGSDTVRLRGGGDLVESLAGRDRLFGGTGDDTFRGSAKSDTFDGGAGTDEYLKQGRPRRRNNTCISVERDPFENCAPS